MNIKKHIPNFITCLNLLCGCVGIIFCFDPILYLVLPSLLIFLACLFDFIDGFAARLLNVASPIGKELDSLADMVSFGLLPGIIIYKMIESPLATPDWIGTVFHADFPQRSRDYLKYTALLIPVFSALRLAKFNIDTRQTTSFIGVPTPANAILISSLTLICAYSPFASAISFIFHPVFLVCASVMFSLLLVSELPLFALKFKDFSWAGNKIRYIFLILSLILLLSLQFIAIPIIIFLYITLSVAENKIFKNSASKP